MNKTCFFSISLNWEKQCIFYVLFDWIYEIIEIEEKIDISDINSNICIEFILVF